jgi:hypothetical protein
MEGAQIYMKKFLMIMIVCVLYIFNLICLDLIPNAHRTTDNIIVLNILIYKFFERSREDKRVWIL